jgi:dsRNA-specific ribonuclease
MRLYEDLNVTCLVLAKELEVVSRLLRNKDYLTPAQPVLCSECSAGRRGTGLHVSGGSRSKKDPGPHTECPEIEEIVKHHVSAVKAIADLLEALVGAVYLDSRGSLETVLSVVRQWNCIDIP